MDETRKAPEQSGALAVPGTKKPYVKPAFVQERAFETMALSCGKINASQSQCKSSKKNS